MVLNYVWLKETHQIVSAFNDSVKLYIRCQVQRFPSDATASAVELINVLLNYIVVLKRQSTAADISDTQLILCVF